MDRSLHSQVNPMLLRELLPARHFQILCIKIKTDLFLWPLAPSTMPQIHAHISDMKNASVELVQDERSHECLSCLQKRNDAEFSPDSVICGPFRKGLKL